MESQVEFNRKKNAEQDKKIDTLSSQITQILEQSPAGFLPRVFYGLSRGAQTYRFIADKVFTIAGLSGNVGDAYELDSMSEPKEYINAVAIQQNSNQIKILIQGDYTVLTTEFKLVNTRTGQSMDVSLTDALSLQDASYLGQYPANENKEKQITVLHDLEDNRDNEVFASVDYSGDGTYNWVHIGGYFNGTDGAGVFGVTNATIANVLTVARVGDLLLAGEAFTYETTNFAIGDLKEIKTLKPFSVEAKGNIRGAQGIQGIQGLPGKDGTNGLTPTIQEGYWWIGDVNTGVKAAGVDGTNGQDGKAFAVQSGLYSAPANVGKTGNTDPEGNALTTLPTLPQTDISGKGFVVYDPLTTPLKPYYDLYWANNGDTEWTIIHPFNGLNGKDGTNGLTPYIKDNNWWIGSTNTGVPATGSQGAQGVGIVTVENTGYTDGEDFTVTHCEATLSNGNKEAFDVQAKHGKQGVQGATGATGATPNISVSATKLPAGSNPTATRTGTDANPIITFGIPSSDSGGGGGDIEIVKVSTFETLKSALNSSSILAFYLKLNSNLSVPTYYTDYSIAEEKISATYHTNTSVSMSSSNIWVFFPEISLDSTTYYKTNDSQNNTFILVCSQVLAISGIKAISSNATSFRLPHYNSSNNVQLYESIIDFEQSYILKVKS